MPLILNTATNPGTAVWTDAELIPSGSTTGDILYLDGSSWVILAPGTAGDQLTTNGAGFAPTWEAPVGTRRLLFPVDWGGNQSGGGTRRVRSVGGSGTFRFNFQVPADFTTLSRLVLVGIPSAGAAGAGRDIDLTSEYASVGEAANFNSETDTTTVYDLTGTSGEITEVLDLSVVFTSLGAGDDCGVFVDHNGIGGSIEYTHILLEYT